jgi:hypothetical protein
MKKLQISTRIGECEEHGWSDLLCKVDEITQSLIDNPSAGSKIKTALCLWCDSVDLRLSVLPPDEEIIKAHNPSMLIPEAFGTEI